MVSSLLADPEVDVFVDGAASGRGARVCTDYTPTSEAVIEIDVSYDKLNQGGCVFGACGSALNQDSFALNYNGGWKFCYSDFGGAAIQVEERARHTIRCSGEGVWLDGVKVQDRTKKTFVAGSPLYVFASKAASISYAAFATVFSLKAWEPDGNGGQQLALDLVPCICTDGLVQMYDRVSGKVFTNANTSFPLAPYITVNAPGGVGDVTALTNALARVNKAQNGKDAIYYIDSTIALQPGRYDLAGVSMASGSHLSMNRIGNAHLIGLGDRPEDTVLVGGGEANACRILVTNGGTTANYAVVSNLTMCGGYSAGSGGAIGMGALYGALNCNSVLFSNNVASSGGALYNGSANNCRFENNRSLKNGGAIARTNDGTGRVRNCTLVANSCGFSQKYGGGGAVFGCREVVGCVFTGNSDGDTGSQYMYGSVAYQSPLTDCVITNSFALRRLVAEGSVTRCRFIGCGKSQASAGADFAVVGNYSAKTTNDVVNSVFDRIATFDAADRVVKHGRLVNSTIRHATGVAGFSPLDTTDGPAVNTIIADSAPYDVVAGQTPAMTNCLWASQSGVLAAGVATDCISTGGARFASGEDSLPGDIKYLSKARDAALSDEWVLNLVGAVDCAGRDRVKFGGLDIGAMECQDYYVPGTRIIVR